MITGILVEGVLERELESHGDGERIVHYAAFPRARLRWRRTILWTMKVRVK
jgi:hypothetical protein